MWGIFASNTLFLNEFHRHILVCDNCSGSLFSLINKRRFVLEISAAARAARLFYVGG